MGRVVLRHLTGSKTGQVESFPLDRFTPLLVGRDLGANVRYDARHDDLVGRRHAIVEKDAAGPCRFTVTDLDSRNGTFVNGQRIAGSSALRPGDVVQFGLGGPELEFQVLNFELRSAMRTRTGLKRAVNQDSARVVCRWRGRRHLLAVVADGLGEHGHGDVASQLTVHTVAQTFDAHDGDDAGEALRKAVAQANRSVFLASQQDAGLRGMRTTCTALVIREGMAVCAHVGDSRLYLVRHGRIEQMTTDDAPAGALGTDLDVEIACWDEPFALRDDDRLLLCTDGLHDFVSDDEMSRMIVTRPPDEACRDLITLALARGGDDNITAAVVHVTSSRGS